MISLIWLVAGIVVGCMVMLVFLRGKYAAERMENSQKLLRSAEQLQQMETQCRREKEEAIAAGTREQEMQRTGYERQLAQQKEHFEQQLAQLKTANAEELTRLQNSFDTQLGQQREAFELRLAEQKQAAAQQLQTERRAFAESSQQIQKAHAEAEARVREECKTIANGVLEQNKIALASENKTQMDGILAPLKEKLENFSKAVTQANEDGIRRNAELGEKIKQMAQSSSNIGEKADKLAVALKSDSKLQGNWGEMSLSRILEQSGMNKGIDFKTQVMLENTDGTKVQHADSGKKLQPDAIVYMPDNRALVIDSKVSLTAFADYHNATDENNRAEALKRHIDSVKKHIDELSEKEYGKYLNECGQTSAGFVLMYIPISGALHLIQQEKPEMIMDASAKHICLVDGMMLMPVLQVIAMAWQFEAQNKNQQEIVSQAVKINDTLHKLFSYVGEMDKYLKKTRDSFDGMVSRMHTGKCNLVSMCKKLNNLGCKASKRAAQLPAILQSTEDEAEEDTPLEVTDIDTESPDTNSYSN